MQRDQMLERTNTLVALVLLVSPAVTLAEDPVARKPKTAKVTFRDQIGPLFRRRCTGRIDVDPSVDRWWPVGDQDEPSQDLQASSLVALACRTIPASPRQEGTE